MDTRAFLKARRDRALGAILGYAEKEVWPLLDEGIWKAFRLVIIEAVDSYHQTILDLSKSDTDVRNEEIYDLLQRVEAQMRASRTT